MPLKTYDPKDVSVIVGGFPMTGFADGEFITVERSNNTFEKATGADGETTRVKQNDKSGEMTLTLMQTSQSNNILTTFAIADEEANAGIVPVLIKEGNSGTILESAFAWIRKPAAVSYGKDVSTREWVFDMADYGSIINGTAAAS